MEDRGQGIRIRIELDLEDADDVAALRGALLAAKGTELAEVQRLGGRLATGYGTDANMPGMMADLQHRRRRAALIDRLIEALDASRG